MIHSRILIQRVVSPDGKSVASAKSIAIASGAESTISQTVTVQVSSSKGCSSSSTSSTSKYTQKN
ncbi:MULTISPECIES: hypothetical protein [Cyanophyceae]|uniref:hypothetical protein n=1 Tax=Cyanophyceae TaxID=3028117 RepID=UPI001688E2A5|nr:hypothetical protein [Trichocoleus sp. FACHB-40]MBD2003777.1 hypothetical protein [Trichocoleus sp. FACHB-40]